MPIPDVDVFNEFLASLTLRQPEAADADFERLEAIPERFLENSSGPIHAEPVFLWYRKSCTLAPATVIERVRKELDHIGHTSTSDMAMVILATQCLASASPESSVRRLNRIIELIGPADSSQYWISAFPPHPDSHTFHLGRFTIGPLNRQKLVYWCTRLGWPNNSGGSITNSAEVIAAGVIQANELPTPLVWIEHWPKESTDGGEETFELVVFSSYEVVERAPYLGETRAWIEAATWKSLDRASVEVLVGGKV
jgi:hypothetical protein